MHRNGDTVFYVIVPVYKAEEVLHRSLGSVLNQTYQNYQVILVDDGSPDRSGEICRQYASREPRFHAIHKENGGQLSARQAGVDFVYANNMDTEHGFFVFLDADDTLQSNMLEIIADTVAQHDCDMVIWGLQRVLEDGTTVKAPNPGAPGVSCDKLTLYRTVFGCNTYNSMCVKAIKCNLMPVTDYSQYYDIRYAEDLVHSMYALKNSEKVVFIPDVLYNYRVNPHSVMHSRTIENYRVDSRVRTMVWEFLEAEQVFEDADWKKYGDYCRRLMREDLTTACTLRASVGQLVSLLERFHNDAYYGRIMGMYQSCDRVMGYLNRKQYLALIIYLRVRSLAIRMLERIKGLRK